MPARLSLPIAPAVVRARPQVQVQVQEQVQVQVLALVLGLSAVAVVATPVVVARLSPRQGKQAVHMLACLWTLTYPV